jgi:hypothetical protein
MGTTIAVYRPYSGGIPAIVANATLWGRTIIAPVKPAKKSALIVSKVVSLNQTINGKIFAN